MGWEEIKVYWGKIIALAKEYPDLDVDELLVLNKQLNPKKPKPAVDKAKKGETARVKAILKKRIPNYKEPVKKTRVKKSLESNDVETILKKLGILK